MQLNEKIPRHKTATAKATALLCEFRIIKKNLPDPAQIEEAWHLVLKEINDLRVQIDESNEESTGTLNQSDLTLVRGARPSLIGKPPRSKKTTGTKRVLFAPVPGSCSKPFSLSPQTPPPAADRPLFSTDDDFSKNPVPPF